MKLSGLLRFTCLITVNGHKGLVSLNKRYFYFILGEMVVASTFIEKDTCLFTLCGQVFPVTKDFLIPEVNDYSVVCSNVNDKVYMFLGPVSFINHDCHPNVQFHSISKTVLRKNITEHSAS